LNIFKSRGVRHFVSKAEQCHVVQHFLAHMLRLA
jgi:hypothetical protein